MGVHLMAYDAQDRHSTFEFAAASVNHIVMDQGNLAGPSGSSASSAAETTGNGQVDTALLAKVVLGLPAYGRNRKDLGDVMTYADIVREHKPGPEVDELADGMYFNGLLTIQKKARWAITNGLLGVMMWEIGQDSQDEATSLLSALRRVQDKFKEAKRRGEARALKKKKNRQQLDMLTSGQATLVYIDEIEPDAGYPFGTTDLSDHEL